MKNTCEFLISWFVVFCAFALLITVGLNILLLSISFVTWSYDPFVSTYGIEKLAVVLRFVVVIVGAVSFIFTALEVHPIIRLDRDDYDLD
jgi:hypothetical protein